MTGPRAASNGLQATGYGLRTYAARRSHNQRTSTQNDQVSTARATAAITSLIGGANGGPKAQISPTIWMTHTV